MWGGHSCPQLLSLIWLENRQGVGCKSSDFGAGGREITGVILKDFSPEGSRARRNRRE
jgi:hypothetical protein